MISNESKKAAAHKFAATFAGALSGSVSQVLGDIWPVSVIDDPYPPTSKERPVHFRLKVDGALHGECFIEFYEEQVANLGARLSNQTVGELTDEHTEALSSAISGAVPALVSGLAEEFGELTFKLDRPAGLAFGGMLVVGLKCSADAEEAPILLYFDGGLLDSLNAGTSKDSDDGEGVRIHPHNLKLVMDVELNVSLRFGQRQLPLREVLELSTGSVIELDRMVDEPVDLFLDGKLIARGEAVIVDGNYGLRVTEIPQPVASHFFN